MDPAAAVAVAVVALAVVLAGAAWGHRRGGLRLEVRVWWGNGERKRGDETGTPPAQDD